MKEISWLNSLQIVLTPGWRCFSRNLLLGFLLLSGMLPAIIQAELWSSTTISGMRDVAMAPNGIIWLTGRNGTVWKSDNIYASSLTAVEGSGFSRIAVGPDGVVWAIKSNGSLWKFAAGTLTETMANEMEDVAIAPEGKVWLVGKNGAIWFNDDQGQQFTRIESSGFSRISAGSDGVVWAVKSDGTLWKFAVSSWTQTTVSGIEDVAVASDGLIWLTGKNGVLWSSLDGGVTFSQDNEVSGLENIAAGRRGAWAVGFDGALWHKFFSPQF